VDIEINQPKPKYVYLSGKEVNISLGFIEACDESKMRKTSPSHGAELKKIYKGTIIRRTKILTKS
jgi:hypothetical protein